MAACITFSAISSRREAPHQPHRYRRRFMTACFDVVDMKHPGEFTAAQAWRNGPVVVELVPGQIRDS